MRLFRSPRPPGSHEAGAVPGGAGNGDPGAVDPPEQRVAGERGISSINRAGSLQSRVTNLFAIGLMSVLGLGLLGWYYAHTFAMQSESRRSAQSAASRQAAGHMPLPPLGPISPPATRAAQPSLIASALGPAPAPPDPTPYALPATADTPAASMYGTPAGVGQPSPWELALERKLSGPAFDANPSGPATSVGQGTVAPHALGSQSGIGNSGALPGDTAGGGPGGELAALLTPTVTPAARPSVLPTQSLLLPKGAFIDCTLETAIDSTLPGMTSCITATDTFSADGTVVLLERGTQLIGETRGQVRQGMARVFVIWTEARTPSGVLVRLDSPGTDALGRSGLTGTVNRHFWQRFGAALLVSTIDAGVQSSLESGSRTVVIDPMASEDVMTEALRGTVDIPPTITVPNGARIQVLVARDVDFRSVYELVPRS